MEFFDPKKLNFNFAKTFKISLTLSVLISVVSVLGVFFPGLNYGVDFRGGVEARLSFPKGDVSHSDLRASLESKFPGVSVVNFEGSNSHEFLVVAQIKEGEDTARLLTTHLAEVYGPKGERWDVSQIDVVGPKVGKELRTSALLSLLYTCILVTLYMYWRFDMRFSPGAIASILHDLTFTVGFLVATQIEFSTVVVAALLTLAGYSINDTVVVYDRIRELEGKYPTRDKRQLVNEAVNSTISRTMMTAGATLVATIVLFFLGGPAIADFAATLFFGILVGTYSSVYVAAPIYLWADRRFGAKSAATVAKAK